MKRILTICFVLSLSLTQLRAQSVSRGSYPNQSQLNVYIENNGTELFDQTEVGFNINSIDSFSSEFDANKFPGALNRETLYTLNNGQWMAINVLPSVSTTPEVPMGLEPGGTGTFTITFSGDSTFDNTSYVSLQDLQANVWHNVRSGSYSFWADSTENWNRFILHFTPPTVISSTAASCNTLGIINIVQPGPADWHFLLTDESNNTIEGGVLNSNNPLMVEVQGGSYTLTLTDSTGYTAVKTITVDGGPTVVSSFTTPTSDITIETPITFTSTSQDAQYLNWDFGDGTTETGVANPSHTYTTPGTYTVTLTASNGLGCSTTFTATVIVSSTTGIAEVTAGSTSIWSHAANVYVDFSKSGNAGAIVKIFDILGREISNEKTTGSSIYQKQILDITDGYVIVNVRNGDLVTNRKVFISNEK